MQHIMQRYFMQSIDIGYDICENEKAPHFVTSVTSRQRPRRSSEEIWPGKESNFPIFRDLPKLLRFGARCILPGTSCER